MQRATGRIEALYRQLRLELSKGYIGECRFIDKANQLGITPSRIEAHIKKCANEWRQEISVGDKRRLASKMARINLSK